MIELTDTHCHIHEAEQGYQLGTETKKKYEKAGSPMPDSFIANAQADGVTRMVCVGTTVPDSELAVSFVQSRDSVWAAIGIHPHDAQTYHNDQDALDRFAALAPQSKVVAVGECGLDYYRDNSPRDAQAAILRFQIELALKHNLPLVFHVRSAFRDFWPIFDSYRGIRGVVHSFSSDTADLEQILQRNLYVGLNGITTFMKDTHQIDAIRAVPLEKMLLETDAPFLTPDPYRDRLCEPKHVHVTAEFLANLRGEPLEKLATLTNDNARKLFGI